MTACGDAWGAPCARQSVLDEHDRAIGKTLTAATSADATAKATHGVVVALAEHVAELATNVDRRFTTLEVQIAGGNAARAVQMSRDWELDEPTLSGREPEQAATLWKVRATEAETQREALAVQLAAANATIAVTDAERTRASNRARAAGTLTLERWKIALGFVATVLTSGVGAAIVARMFGG